MIQFEQTADGIVAQENGKPAVFNQEQQNQITMVVAGMNPGASYEFTKDGHMKLGEKMSNDDINKIQTDVNLAIGAAAVAQTQTATMTAQPNSGNSDSEDDKKGEVNLPEDVKKKLQDGLDKLQKGEINQASMREFINEMQAELRAAEKNDKLPQAQRDAAAAAYDKLEKLEDNLPQMQAGPAPKKKAAGIDEEERGGVAQSTGPKTWTEMLIDLLKDFLGVDDKPAPAASVSNAGPAAGAATQPPAADANKDAATPPAADANKGATAQPPADANKDAATPPAADANKGATAQPPADANKGATAQPPAADANKGATAQPPAADANKDAATPPAADANKGTAAKEPVTADPAKFDEARKELAESVAANMSAREGKEVKADSKEVQDKVDQFIGSKVARAGDDKEVGIMKDEAARLAKETTDLKSFEQAYRDNAEMKTGYPPSADEVKNAIAGLEGKDIGKETQGLMAHTAAGKAYMAAVEANLDAKGITDPTERETQKGMARENTYGEVSGIDAQMKLVTAETEAVNKLAESARKLAAAEGKTGEDLDKAEKGARESARTMDVAGMEAKKGEMDKRTDDINANIEGYKTQLALVGEKDVDGKVKERQAYLANTPTSDIGELTDLDKGKTEALAELKRTEEARAALMEKTGAIPQGKGAEYVQDVMAEAGKHSTSEIQSASKEAGTELETLKGQAEQKGKLDKVIAAEEQSVNAKVAAGMDPTQDTQSIIDAQSTQKKTMADILAAAGGIDSFKTQLAAVGGIKLDKGLDAPNGSLPTDLKGGELPQDMPKGDLAKNEAGMAQGATGS